MPTRSALATATWAAGAGLNENELRPQEKHVRDWKRECCENVWELAFEEGVPRECPRCHGTWLHLLVKSTYGLENTREET